MINPELLPDNVLSDILAFENLPDNEEGYAKVAMMKPHVVFDKFLRFNGFVGYTNMLIEALEGIQEATVKLEKVNDNTNQQ